MVRQTPAWEGKAGRCPGPPAGPRGPRLILVRTIPKQQQIPETEPRGRRTQGLKAPAGRAAKKCRNEGRSGQFLCCPVWGPGTRAPDGSAHLEPTQGWRSITEGSWSSSDYAPEGVYPVVLGDRKPHSGARLAPRPLGGGPPELLSRQPGRGPGLAPSRLPSLEVGVLAVQLEVNGRDGLSW